jgi:acyl-CoA synthetase (AMP-forming)/AMP-acid ligase II/3-oxoacyl-(acyl-carrier-protein) synthase/acyl carrier protein
MNARARTTSGYLERAAASPQRQFLLFRDADGQVAHVSGARLIGQVRRTARILQSSLPAGDRALLLLPQGLSFAYAFLACLDANVIAVPFPVIDLSNLQSLKDKIAAIAADSGAALAVTDQTVLSHIGLDGLGGLPVMDMDARPSSPSRVRGARPNRPDDVALLLYTSGSTALPKGVALTHAQLMAQSQEGAEQWGLTESSRVVSWTPVFHNVGLRFGILAPLLRGAVSQLLPPDSFVRRPETWFEVISAWQATHTAAPNFAFDLCCSAIADTAVAHLSLASLIGVFNGGEPIRSETVDRFARRFASLGLRREACGAHYGLSEAGSVTASPLGRPLRTLSADVESLQQGRLTPTDVLDERTTTLASCGVRGRGFDLLIVDPATSAPVEPGVVGELWVRGAAVAAGYWHQEEATAQTFNNVVSGHGEAPFLRTGDLGFISDDHLFIVGRRKEVIIVHGKNHHPAELEATIAQELGSAVTAVAVFSCDIDQQERVVVVAELQPRAEEPRHVEIASDILRVVSHVHALDAYEVVLVRDGSLPRTATGKLQRRLCRTAYIEGTLPVVHTHRHSRRAQSAASKPTDTPEPIAATLRTLLARELGLPASARHDIVDLGDLGVDSVSKLRFASRIEEHFGISFDAVDLFKCHRIDSLARHVAEVLDARPRSISVDSRPDLSQRSSFVQRAADTDVAIVGWACQFPGGIHSPEELWRHLMSGMSSVTTIPDERWRLFGASGVGQDDSEPFPRLGAFIDDVDRFDADFFGVSKVEAEAMDPQQRKLLELTWTLFENAGYNPKDVDGQNVAVFVGVHSNDYLELIASRPRLAERYGAFLDSGVHPSMIANRLSRWFGLRGPSEIINTACSSSLVAVHHGYEAVSRGSCEMAVVAGVNLILSTRLYRASAAAGMLAADGRCKTFSHDADGFARAEGIAALLLKPYGAARRDGDVVYGVIKSAVINHDGRSSSLRAPNLDAQRELLVRAYQAAAIPLETVTYVEAHGTGTPLGDPIEVRALREAFDALQPGLPAHGCGLGTIKTNLGHCESASGIAGVIKVLLSMRHATLPGLLNFTALNPHIPLEDGPFQIVDHTRPWRRSTSTDGCEAPRRAGVSSFGFGGVNAHVVVEECLDSSPPPTSITALDPALIVISARSQERLRVWVRRLLDAIETMDDSQLPSIALTLQVGRASLDHRLATTAASIAELKSRLSTWLESEDVDGVWYGDARQFRHAALLFDGDADAVRLFDAWLTTRKYTKLLQAWVSGIDIDWNRLRSDSRPPRIALPGYPFQKTRFWLDDDAPRDATSVHASASQRADQPGSIDHVLDSVYRGDVTVEEAIADVESHLALHS